MRVAKQNLQQPVQRDINPQFQSRLPKILEEICSGLIVIEPAMTEVATQLKEFREYLDFEIAKTKLDISQEEWKAQCNPKKLEADKRWLAKLSALRKDFDVDVMTSPITIIRSMVDRVEEMFGPLN
jgi:hypothetical protein